MNIFFHCRNCANRIPHPTENGIACKLTQERPNFNKTCSTISFGEDLKQNLINSNLKVAYLKRQNTSAFIHLFTFLLLGIVTIVGGLYIKNYLYKMGWWTSIHYIVIVIGLVLIAGAIKPILAFLTDKKNALQALSELEELLTLYNINYEIDFKFGKKFHSKEMVEYKLDLNGVHSTDELEIDRYLVKH